MRYLLLPLTICSFAVAQEARYTNPEPSQHSIPANLPAQPVGPGDLLLISIYGSPELSRSVRVSTEGEIRLPMLKQLIPVAGALPSAIETSLTKALVTEEILVDPVVTVTVAEYHSRPISIGGAVRNPTTFQAVGPTTLLQAITQAGGLEKAAGQEILVTLPLKADAGERSTLRVPVRMLMDTADPKGNLILTGGEEIRVPEGLPVFVVGNVKKPGVFSAADAPHATVLKAVALAEGLLPYSSKQAYVYRADAAGARQEIIIDLTQILDRKTPDSALQPGDVLYIPDRKGRKLAAAAFDKLFAFGSSAGATALIYAAR